MPRHRKFVSQKQLAANRANAARSTGPRTPQGKARSAQNGLKHGFAASTFAVVRLEDLQEIARLRADLIAVHRPVNAQELFAIERIALAEQVVLRATRLETGLFTTCLNEALNPSGAQPPCQGLSMNEDLTGIGDIAIARAQNGDYLLGEGFHRMAIQSNSWTLAKRYQAQAERHYRQAVEEFDRLKALRPKSVKSENRPIWDAQPNQRKPLNPIPVGQTPPSAAASLTGLRALRPALAKTDDEAILESQPNQSKSLNHITGGFASIHEPISTPVWQTPTSVDGPLAGLSSQAPASGSSLPVLPGLPTVFGSPHLSDTTNRGSEDLVRTPR
jgi:hypothetical protein